MSVSSNMIVAVVVGMGNVIALALTLHAEIARVVRKRKWLR